MRESGKSVAVVGGGILGLFLASQLHRSGFSVEILEGSSQVGGLARSAELSGFSWDRFYHVILPSDLNLRRLLEELELTSKLRWGTTRTGFFTDGALYSLSSSIEFLRFPPLSLIDKIRLGGTILSAARMKNWRKLEQIPVGDWLTRWSGKRVYERIWLPLLRSKLGDNHRIASAAFIWAIIQRMYAARQSGMKREMFGYVEGGYALILRRLQELLDQRGIVTRTGARVSEISRHANGVEVRFEDESSRTYNSVICTIPTPAIARICPQLTRQERERLTGVTYQGIVCASLLLRKPLADFYVTNITDDWVPFTGVIEMTALVDPAVFGGNSLVYLPRYLTQEDSFWDTSDTEIQRLFLSAVERMYPDFSRPDVLDIQVSRARQVLAVSTLGYSEKSMPTVETSIPGVYIVNSAQIAQGTLNVNETLGVVKDRLPELLAAMRRPSYENSNDD